MRASSLRRSLLAAAALALAVAAPARAELRISDLAVFLNDHEVTVHVVLLGAVPEAFQEGIQSGIPAHVRVTVELWQYNRYWRDQLLMAKVVERTLVYNVVTKELKVTSLKGEARPVHITRDFRDAHRELSELRGDRKSTRLNSSHITISYAVFCLKKKTTHTIRSLELALASDGAGEFVGPFLNEMMAHHVRAAGREVYELGRPVRARLLVYEAAFE